MRVRLLTSTAKAQIRVNLKRSCPDARPPCALSVIGYTAISPSRRCLGARMSKFSRFAFSIISAIGLSPWAPQTRGQGCGCFWRQQAATQVASDMPAVSVPVASRHLIW